MTVISLLAYFASKKPGLIPGRFQVAAELFVGGLDEFVRGILGPKGRTYTPFIGDVGGGVTFSAHNRPAKILADYFIKSMKCEITIIGIQPKSLEFGKPASPSVRKSAKYVAKSLSIAAKK